MLLEKKIQETVPSDWEFRGIMGGIHLTKEEDGELQNEGQKTVGKFIHDFNQLIIHICLFRHEDGRENLLFQKCPVRAINMCCGHPRIVMAKFLIALNILLVANIIDNLTHWQLWRQIWKIGDMLWNSDTHASVDYHEAIYVEKDSGKIPGIHSKYQHKQTSIGNELFQLRLQLEKLLENVK